MRYRIGDYEDDYRDLHYGKFDSPMAHYLYSAVMLNGDDGDDSYSDGDGTWGNRYGRRVLEGDDRGFVYYARFDTEAEADEAFAPIARLNNLIGFLAGGGDPDELEDEDRELLERGGYLEGER